MMKEVYVVETCNIWKEYTSFVLVGIFTSRKNLNTVLNTLLKDKKIEWNEDTDPKPSVNKLSYAELHDQLDYVFISKITLNEYQ